MTAHCAFAFVGPVFGIILQSTRGIMSIIVGVAVSRLGLLHIEAHITHNVFIQRLAAALLMTIAVALYAMT